MQTEYDLVIIGGGLVGASLACALADTPLSIAVVEQHEFSKLDHASYDDRSVALSYSTRLLFDSLGLWQSISPFAEAIQNIHVSEKGSFGSTRLNSSSEDVSALGYVIENRSLGNVLVERMRAANNVTLICPASIESLENSAETSSNIIADINYQGEKIALKARLLIAADGVQSRVRDLLDIGVTHKDYQQAAIICNVTPELAHNGVAWERFTDSGPLAFLPLPDFNETGRASSMTAVNKNLPRCSVVWTVNSDMLDEIMALDDESFLMRLQSRFGYRLGQLLKTGKRSAYPLALLQANKSVDKNVLLIGNASHTLHPVAGQGFNLGMRDVGVLAELLLNAVHANQDIADSGLLEHYANTRTKDYEQIIRFTDNLVHWFSFNLKPVKIARSIGLVLTDRIPWLKSAIARRAMGFNQRMPIKR